MFDGEDVGGWVDRWLVGLGKWHSQRENFVPFSILWIALDEVGNATGYFLQWQILNLSITEYEMMCDNWILFCFGWP